MANYLSSDTDRVVNFAGSFHAAWSLPLQFVVTLVLLYYQVGWACLVGVVISALMVPVNKCIANAIGKHSGLALEAKDRRISLMTEILGGIRVIKCFAWERHFFDNVRGVRTTELRHIKWKKYLDALCVYLWATTPVIISILTFGSYVLFIKQRLTAATVFTRFAL